MGLRWLASGCSCGCQRFHVYISKLCLCMSPLSCQVHAVQPRVCNAAYAGKETAKHSWACQTCACTACKLGTMPHALMACMVPTWACKSVGWLRSQRSRQCQQRPHHISSALRSGFFAHPAVHATQQVRQRICLHCCCHSHVLCANVVVPRVLHVVC